MNLLMLIPLLFIPLNLEAAIHEFPTSFQHCVKASESGCSMSKPLKFRINISGFSQRDEALVKKAVDKIVKYMVRYLRVKESFRDRYSETLHQYILQESTRDFNSITGPSVYENDQICADYSHFRGTSRPLPQNDVILEPLQGLIAYFRMLALKNATFDIVSKPLDFPILGQVHGNDRNDHIFPPRLKETRECLERYGNQPLPWFSKIYISTSMTPGTNRSIIDWVVAEEPNQLETTILHEMMHEIGYWHPDGHQGSFVKEMGDNLTRLLNQEWESFSLATDYGWMEWCEDPNLSSREQASVQALKAVSGQSSCYIASQELKTIRELSLSYNDGMKSTLPLSTLTWLKKLYLANTPVRDLGGLWKMETLTELNLSGTAVTDLEPLRNLHSLTWLNLAMTSIKDLSPLYELHNLRRLNLLGTGVEESSVRSLQERIPNCTVIY